MTAEPTYKKQEKNRGKELKDYWPLMSLILIAASAGYALTLHTQGGLMNWMHYFMGIFLCCFAMLKMFNLSAFADGFQMYDLIATRSRAYAYVYPFIELGLGLSFLAFLAPTMTYTVTIIVMVLGTFGVVSALRQDLDINCPCMGSVLDVPLSTVTLTEDLGMGIMAAIMLMTTTNVF